MKSETTICIAAMIAIAVLAIPVRMHSQEEKKGHHRYKLFDLGTFGGPSSLVNGEPTQNVINDRGVVVGGADTSLPSPDPNCFNPVFNPDCFVSHAFRWHDGVLTDLGTLPGGAFSVALSINDRGVIAGTSENGVPDPQVGTPEFHAVIWRHSKILDLGTLGGTSSFAGAINNRNQVTGPALNAVPDQFSMLVGNVTQTRAFLWQRGEMRDLGTLGGPDAFPVTINEGGQVAGISYTNFNANSGGVPTIEPFLWEEGRMAGLGSFGGTFGIANALNSRGQVVGASNLAGDQTTHAFFWDRGVLTDIGTLGGSFSFATYLNGEGEVTGFATLSGDQVSHAFLWKNGAMTDLGTVDGDPCSTAESINLSGQIVGASQSAAGGCNAFMAAILWENGEPGVDLNTLVPLGSALQLTDAVDINGSGEIAGRGVPPGCVNADTCGHAFLLIPCDENHASVEGCDHERVDPATAAEIRPAQTAQPTAAGASQAKLSAAEMMARYRAMTANRYRRLGTLPPK